VHLIILSLLQVEVDLKTRSGIIFSGRFVGFARLVADDTD